MACQAALAGSGGAQPGRKQPRPGMACQEVRLVASGREKDEGNGPPNDISCLFKLLKQNLAMAKFILALALAMPILLLAGCAGPPLSYGNHDVNVSTIIKHNGTGNATVVQNGTALVTVLSVVSGCGIQPPDGNLSSCGVHSATPFPGKFNLSIYSINTKTMQPGLPEPIRTSVQADANGEFSLYLQPGDYMLGLYDSKGNGIESNLFALYPGKTARVSMNFTYQVPASRQ